MPDKNIFYEEGFADVNGVRLHYVSQGSGKLALLLHGFPEFWYSWRHQLPLLSEKYRAVAPDLRGYNTSDKPRGIKSYYIEELVEDVKGLIDFFGADRAVIISHDWGGVIAWDLAAHFPEVVDKLVVMNAPHPAAYMREIKRNYKQLLSSWYVLMFQIPGFPEWYIRKNDFREIEKVFSGWARREDAFQDDDIQRFKEAIGRPGSLTAMINYYRALLRNPGSFKRLKNFPKIEVPTLLIWAEKDRALTNELTYNLLPYFNAPLEIRYVPDCSHWVQQEQPEIVNKYLREFLF